MKKFLACILSVVITALTFSAVCMAYTPKEAKAVKATAVIDAEMEDVWKETDVLEVSIVNKTIIYNEQNESQTTAEVRLLWDEKNLYFYCEVEDIDLFAENKLSSPSFIPDGIEFQIDEGNDKSGKNNVPQGNPEAGSFQVFANSTSSGFGDKYTDCSGKFNYAVKITGDGYTVEAAVPWNTLKPEVGTEIGVEIQINDNITGNTREGLVSWNSDACLGWQDTEAMGTIRLADSPEGYVPPVIETETEPETESDTEKETEKQTETEKDETEKDVTDAKTEEDITTGKDTVKPSEETDVPESGNGNTVVWIVAAAVIVVAAAVIIIISVKRKKK